MSFWYVCISSRLLLKSDFSCISSRPNKFFKGLRGIRIQHFYGQFLLKFRNFSHEKLWKLEVFEMLTHGNLEQIPEGQTGIRKSPEIWRREKSETKIRKNNVRLAKEFIILVNRRNEWVKRGEVEKAWMKCKEVWEFRKTFKKLNLFTRKWKSLKKLSETFFPFSPRKLCVKFFLGKPLMKRERVLVTFESSKTEWQKKFRLQSWRHKIGLLCNSSLQSSTHQHGRTRSLAGLDHLEIVSSKPFATFSWNMFNFFARVSSGAWINVKMCLFV